MLILYPIKIRQQNNLLNFWSPDFKKNLLSSDVNIKHPDLVRHLQEQISAEVDRLLSVSTAIPLPSSSFKLDGTYISISMEIEIKIGLLEKLLPRLASFSNFIVVLFTVFNAFLSLQLSFGESFNQDYLQDLIGYVGAAGQFFALLLFYMISGASEVLKDIGRRMDIYIGGDRRVPYNILSGMPWYNKVLFVFTSMVLTIVLIDYILVSAIQLSQGSITVIQKAVEKNIIVISEDLIYGLSQTMAGISIYPNAAYTLNFFIKFLQILQSRLQGVPRWLASTQATDVENPELEDSSASGEVRSLLHANFEGPSLNPGITPSLASASAHVEDDDDAKFYSCATLAETANASIQNLLIPPYGMLASSPSIPS